MEHCGFSGCKFKSASGDPEHVRRHRAKQHPSVFWCGEPGCSFFSIRDSRLAVHRSTSGHRPSPARPSPPARLPRTRESITPAPISPCPPAAVTKAVQQEGVPLKFGVSLFEFETRSRSGNEVSCTARSCCSSRISTGRGRLVQRLRDTNGKCHFYYYCISCPWPDGAAAAIKNRLDKGSILGFDKLTKAEQLEVESAAAAAESAAAAAAAPGAMEWDSDQFSDSDLGDSDLEASDLEASDLEDSDLEDSDLEACNLEDSNLEDARPPRTRAMGGFAIDEKVEVHVGLHGTHSNLGTIVKLIPASKSCLIKVRALAERFQAHPPPPLSLAPR